MKPRLLIALLCASGALGQFDQRIHRVETGLLRAVALKGKPPEKLNLPDRMRIYNVPGVSIAVVSGGEVQWARGYGFASAEERNPVTPETLFQAASISKPVAAMTALRLVELGKLSLDEDVNAKLKSWKVAENEFTAKEKVTLRRLLSHTAGLTVHGFPGYAAGAPVPTLRQVLDGAKPANSAPIRPDTVPGTRYSYSGGGYEVMQQLVEEVTGRPFAGLARELVLQPLGMVHSTYEQPLPAAYRVRASTAYGVSGKPIEGKWHTYPEMTAAGLWTTPSDLAHLILEIQKPGRVLKPATVKEMLTPILNDYGMGLSTREAGGDQSFGHGGANAGFRCQLAGHRDAGTGAVVMTNGDRGGALAMEITRAISAEYGWPDYKPETKIAAVVSDKILEIYAGKYEIGGARLTITVRNGGLWADAGADGNGQLVPESQDLFFDPDGEIPPMRFRTQADGSVELKIGDQTVKRK
jgi:CubicO group peptidase (beta-lactamase class C family)